MKQTKRWAVSLSALLLAAALAACQGPAVQPGASSSAGSESASPPLSSGPGDPPPESSRPEAPSPAVLSASEGVEYQTVYTWKPGEFQVSPVSPPGSQRLLVEAVDYQTGGAFLLGFDLGNGQHDMATGHHVSSLDLSRYRSQDIPYEVRPVLGDDGAVRIVTAEGFRQYGWDGLEAAPYTLPEVAKSKAGPPYENYFGWDALPEKDLLAWADESGVWLASADGTGPKLVFANPSIREQPEFAALAEQYSAAGGPLVGHAPRLLGEGSHLVVEIGSPMSQMGEVGLAVCDLTEGKIRWYRDVFVVCSAERLEYLDNTTLLAGVSQIDVTTGEVRRAPRDLLTERFYAISGGFSHFYGVESTDTEYRLVSCTEETWQDAKPFLTLPRHPAGTARDGAYTRLFPFAVGKNKVVCQYERQDEEGLLLVTLPDDFYK